MLNPYSPTHRETTNAKQDKAERRISLIVRPAIYLQLVAVALTGLGMTHDIRSIIWPKQWIPLLEASLIFGTLSFWVFPIVVLFGLSRSTTTASQRMILVGVEVMILVAHFIALIPGLQ